MSDANPYAPPATDPNAPDVSDPIETERRQLLRTEGFIRAIALVAFTMALVNFVHLKYLVIWRNIGIFDPSASGAAELLSPHHSSSEPLSDTLRWTGIALLVMAGGLLFQLHRAGRTLLMVGVVLLFLGLASARYGLAVWLFPDYGHYLDRSVHATLVVLPFAVAGLFLRKPRVVLHRDYRPRVIAATPAIRSPIALWTWLLLPIALVFGLGAVSVLLRGWYP